MADPRNAVTLVGIGYEAETFLIDNSTITYLATAAGGTASANLAVTFSAADTVKLAEDGEAVVGKLIEVHSDNKAVVQTGGYVELPGGASASLTRGKKIVGALGAASAKGYIREVATATAAELGVARGMITNAATTTAVVVRLECAV
jgi:hypothetical protein